MSRRNGFFYFVVLCVLGGFLQAQSLRVITLREQKEPIVEELTPIPTQIVFERLILQDMFDHEGGRIPSQIESACGILCTDGATSKQVFFGCHAFLYGMAEAYRTCRGFTLSPDMLYFLIAEAFVIEKAVEPVDHSDVDADSAAVYSLIINASESFYGKKATQWESLFKKVEERERPDLSSKREMLTPLNFSTASYTTQLASELTLYDQKKPHFEYTLPTEGKGISAIHLLGSVEDWDMLLEKVKQMEAATPRPWISDLLPVLTSIRNAAAGKGGAAFWKKMFVYQEKTRAIEGWVLHFFPYNQQGEARENKQEKVLGSLPNQLIKVPIVYVDKSEEPAKKTKLELWAGFTGVEEDPLTHAIKPVMGWMIRKVQ